MASIDSVTTPLVLRQADGSGKLVAACFPHPRGLLYLDLCWHLSTPAEAAHLIDGELRGEGPAPATAAQMIPLYQRRLLTLTEAGDPVTESA